MNRTYKLVKHLVKIVTRFLFPYKITGKEKLDREGPFMIIMNHKGLLDPLYLIDFTKRPIHFFAKKNLSTWPILSYFFNRVELIYVDRTVEHSGTTKYGIEYLNKGKVVGIFPEGHRKKTDEIEILPFKYGAFKMASATKVPVVPIIMHKRPKFFSKKLSFEVLDPVFISDDLDMEKEKMEKLYKDKVKDETIKNK